MNVLDRDRSYTFSKIFELKIQPRDLADDLGYSFQRKWLKLPQYKGELDRLEQLRARVEEILPYVDLTNEATRREMLISPVVLELIHYTKSEVRIEYPIKVTEQPQGSFDYLLETDRNLVVIEAKQEDLTNGFTQLMAELIALAQWREESQQTQFIGAVTTGKIWEFGRLDRDNKHIDRGLESYRVPEDVESVLRILVHALTV